MIVTVINGPNRIEHNVAGTTTTVGALRDELGGVLGITGNAQATVNGNAADRQTRVRDGDEVSFTKPTGQKG